MTTPRERIRAAVDGNCVPSIDPERYAELVVGVLRRDLAEDPKARARRFADQTKSDALATERSIA